MQAVVKERFVKAAFDMDPTWAIPLKSERAEDCNMHKIFSDETSVKAVTVPESADKNLTARKKSVFSAHYKSKDSAKSFSFLVPRHRLDFCTT